MKHILITSDRLKFVIEPKEYKAVVAALNAGKKFVVVQGSVISLAIAPTIITFERWYAQENERLALTDKRLCKKCLCIMSKFTSCKCWDETGLAEAQNAFEAPRLPESVKKMLPSAKAFPEVTESHDDLLAIELKARI